MSTSTLLAVMLAIVSLAAVGLGADADTANLLKNGDFASATNGQPEAWTTSGDPATVTQQLTLEQDPEVGRYARLNCTRCDPGTAASHAMLAQPAVILKKGRTYEFSAQMRASGIRGGVVSVAMRNTANWTDCGLFSDIAITDRWATYRKVFQATQDTTQQSRLQIWYAEPGTLDLRDVRIVEYAQQQARFTDVVPAGTSRNLLRNGSFECSSVGWSSLGQGVGWGNLAFLRGTIEQGSAADGKSFLRIPLGPGKTPELAFDYYQPVIRRELAPLAASLGWIPVEPGKPYTLSCQMRGSEAAIPAIIGVTEQNPAGNSQERQKKVNLTTGWAQYALTFRPKSRYVFVTVGPSLPEERAVHVDIDAVQLEQGEKPTDYIAHASVEVGLATPAKGGIYYVGAGEGAGEGAGAGEPAELLVHVANAADAAREITVQFEAKDYYSQTLQLPPLKVQAAPRATTTARVTIPTDWRGYYEVTASSAEATSPATLRLAIVPQRTSSDTICGINHAFADGDLIPLAQGAGVSWYRDWSLKFQHIEPKPGEWHWEIGDAQINRVLKQNLHILPLLPPFPSAEWNSEAPASPASTGYPGTRIRHAWAPQDPQQLADFITAAVNRYKGQIGVWEFLNEPLYTDYALPADEANKHSGRKYGPADYVKLLAVASKAMKAADPNCRVIGGLAGGPMQNMTRELLDAGLLEHIDILNLHMYPGLQAPESFARVMDSELKLMDSHPRGGGRKPIWITEFSYYGTDKLSRDPFVPISWNWAENRLLADERQCADYTVRYFLIMLSHGVERIFIHSGASGAANRTDLECAIFDYGGTPRKLYPALAVLTNLLGGSPKSAGSGRIGNDGWCAAFETGSQGIVACWATRETAAKLPGRADLKWMDTIGRQLDAPPTKLSTSPVYLIAPSGQAAKLLAEVCNSGGSRGTEH